MRRIMTVVASLAFLPGSAFADGGVKGKVSFTGAPPKADKVKMSATPYCLEQHKDGFPFYSVAVDGSGGLAEAFVYVKKGLEGKRFDAPKDAKVVFDQKGCWYAPRIFGIMVGQKLEILNSDKTMHNVNATPYFNAAMPTAGMKLEKTFTKAQVMFKLKCNVHPWMTAYAGVLDHPFYAVTGKDGGFEIKGLPAGKYTVEVWHEKLGTATQDVEVKDGAAAASFTLGAKAKGKG